MYILVFLTLPLWSIHKISYLFIIKIQQLPTKLVQILILDKTNPWINELSLGEGVGQLSQEAPYQISTQLWLTDLKELICLLHTNPLSLIWQLTTNKDKNIRSWIVCLIIIILQIAEIWIPVRGVNLILLIWYRTLIYEGSDLSKIGPFWIFDPWKMSEVIYKEFFSSLLYIFLF